MKKAILLLAVLAAACAPRVPENEFHIEGRVSGIRDSTVIDVTRWNGNTGMNVATDTIIGGRFSFVLPMTDTARLSIFPRGDEFPGMIRVIWGVPGERITVTGDGPLYATWNIKSRVPEQRESDRYIFQSKEEFIRRQQLSVEYNKAHEITDRAVGRAIRDSLNALEDEIDFAIFRNDIALMERSPVSEIWLENLGSIARMVGAYENYAGEFRDDAVRLYERLAPEERELPEVQDIKFALFPPEKVGVGDRMADAELKALDGSVHKLSDYLGKYLIIDFWSSGCGPCIMSMPELKRLVEKYPDDLNTVGINTDTSEEAWRKGTEMFKPSEPNLNAPPASDIDERYGVNGIPHFVIVSPEGVILDSWAGYGEGLIEQRLSAHLNKP